MVDTNFVSACQSDAIMGKDLLARYKWVELIVRIANGKYVENNKECATRAEAVEKLLTEVLLKNYQWEPWQEFRDNFCYTLEVNDVLEANIDGIEGLMRYYHQPRKAWMTRKDVVNLFSKDSMALIPEKVVVQCFGMSKMTVVNEIKEAAKKYDRIELSEFCEMICRCAENKLKVTGISNSQMIE